MVGSDKIAQFEEGGVFPEIITLGADVMYELWYDDTGLQKGGFGS